MSKQNKKLKFGGRQILLLGLVALVITAGYYRWNLEKANFSEVIPTAGEVTQEENNESFSEEIAKLKQTRDSSRSQSVEEWTKITKSSESSAEMKKEAENKISQETDFADKERKIETQVKAKGYEDCIAYVAESGVAVTVKGGEIAGSKMFLQEI